jgi:hypothetical protein
MPKKNTKNLLVGQDKEQWVVEAHQATKNGVSDQETQVGMAGPWTADTVRRHRQTNKP